MYEEGATEWQRQSARERCSGNHQSKPGSIPICAAICNGLNAKEGCISIHRTSYGSGRWISLKTSGPRSGTTLTSKHPNPTRPCCRNASCRVRSGSVVRNSTILNTSSATEPATGPPCSSNLRRSRSPKYHGTSCTARSASSPRPCAAWACSAATASSPTSQTSRRPPSHSWLPPAWALSGQAARPTSARTASSTASSRSNPKS